MTTLNQPEIIDVYKCVTLIAKKSGLNLQLWDCSIFADYFTANMGFISIMCRGTYLFSNEENKILCRAYLPREAERIRKDVFVPLSQYKFKIVENYLPLFNKNIKINGSSKK